MDTKKRSHGTCEPQTLDDIDCNILAELQKNARIPFAELGRRVRLSTPATIERGFWLRRSGNCSTGLMLRLF